MVKMYVFWNKETGETLIGREAKKGGAMMVKKDGKWELAYENRMSIARDKFLCKHDIVEHFYVKNHREAVNYQEVDGGAA